MSNGAIAWEVVPAIQRLALIGRLDGRAVGIVEWDGAGYRAVTCDGAVLGTFSRVAEAEAALDERMSA